MVTSLESLRLQGYPSTLKVPFNITSSDMKDFAGEVMFLPSLATVIWSTALWISLVAMLLRWKLSRYYWDIATSATGHG